MWDLIVIFIMWIMGLGLCKHVGRCVFPKSTSWANTVTRKTNENSVKLFEVQQLGRVLGCWEGQREGCGSRCSLS